MMKHLFHIRHEKPGILVRTIFDKQLIWKPINNPGVNKTVIIIGAGAAGILAARQLPHARMKVIV